MYTEEKKEDEAAPEGDKPEGEEPKPAEPEGEAAATTEGEGEGAAAAGVTVEVDVEQGKEEVKDHSYTKLSHSLVTNEVSTN